MDYLSEVTNLFNLSFLLKEVVTKTKLESAIETHRYKDPTQAGHSLCSNYLIYLSALVLTGEERRGEVAILYKSVCGTAGRRQQAGGRMVARKLKLSNIVIGQWSATSKCITLITTLSVTQPSLSLSLSLSLSRHPCLHHDHIKYDIPRCKKINI